MDQIAGEMTGMNIASPTPSDDNGSAMSDGDAVGLWVGIAFGGALIIGLMANFLYFCGTKFDQEKNLRVIVQYTKEWFKVDLNLKDQEMQETISQKSGPLHVALLYHPELSAWFRYLIPIALLGNFAIFLDSNIVNGASKVNVKAIVAGAVIQDGSIYKLGLGDAVHDMWEAKVYALAILILFFSSMWPYIKIVGMLLLWCLPVRYCSLACRENWLIFFDACGKWALIDCFVMVFMLCAFYLEHDFLNGLVQVQVTTEPIWGYYSLLWGIITSSILSHVIISAHRYVTKPTSVELIKQINDDEPVSSVGSALYVFYRETNAFGSDVTHALTTTKHRIIAKWTWYGYAFVHAILIIVVLTYIIGLHTITIAFQIDGKLGPFYLTKTTDYSVISIGTTIPQHSGVTGDPGVQWMQVCFFGFVILAPSLYLICLLILWNVPMTFVTKSYVMFVTEIINAWAALDVYAVATLASLSQVEQFAKFIMGDCSFSAASSSGGIMALQSIRSQKMIAPGIDACFNVVGKFYDNSWLLFFPAFGIMVMGSMTLMACHHTLIQRIHPDYMSAVPPNVGTVYPTSYQYEESSSTISLFWLNFTWQNLGYNLLCVMNTLKLIEIIQEDNLVVNNDSVNSNNKKEDDISRSIQETAVARVEMSQL